jgi:hypothetical protein
VAEIGCCGGRVHTAANSGYADVQPALGTMLPRKDRVVTDHPVRGHLSAPTASDGGSTNRAKLWKQIPKAAGSCCQLGGRGLTPQHLALTQLPPTFMLVCGRPSAWLPWQPWLAAGGR